MIEIMTMIATGLVYAVAGMFLLLSAICAVGCIFYPFYILLEGIRNKLL